jgi:AAA+ ATPase superfamily predicted ATPase
LLSVPLPFLDRTRELQRLGKALRATDGALVCLYGRRRLGKSRLIRELCEKRSVTSYTGDERDAPLQRQAVAREIGRTLTGFDQAQYPDWEALLARWWHDAPKGTALVLDEFPSVVSRSPELPSVLQKLVDAGPRPRSVILCGSSQRMMQGLVLDRSAPLFGRAKEILRLDPIGASFIQEALRVDDPALAVEHHAVWGGIPRYWELARETRGLWPAVREHVLDPLGVLHHEPDRLLLDETSDLARTASVLNVVARGSHRVSQIGARLSLPATALSRPLAQLVELGLLDREVPFGEPAQSSKRSLYRVADPFLAFWFRFVDPNRSRLASEQIDEVETDIRKEWSTYLGHAWECLVRASVPRASIAKQRWQPASRWWGKDQNGNLLEIDVIARAIASPKHLLVGEVKVQLSPRELPRVQAELASKIARCPLTRGKKVTAVIWVLRSESLRKPKALLLGPKDVLSVLT